MIRSGPPPLAMSQVAAPPAMQRSRPETARSPASHSGCTCSCLSTQCRRTGHTRAPPPAPYRQNSATQTAESPKSARPAATPAAAAAPCDNPWGAPRCCSTHSGLSIPFPATPDPSSAAGPSYNWPRTRSLTAPMARPPSPTNGAARPPHHAASDTPFLPPCRRQPMRRSGSAPRHLPASQAPAPMRPPRLRIRLHGRAARRVLRKDLPSVSHLRLKDALQRQRTDRGQQLPPSRPTRFPPHASFRIETMRVLVTGAAGFLGSHLTDALLGEGHSVIGVDNLSTGSTANLAHLTREPRFEYVQRDITGPFDVGRVDYVFNFASPASPVDYSRLGPETLLVGSLGARHAL